MKGLKGQPMPAIGGSTNGGSDTISNSEPYSVKVTIEGVVPIIFHGWNPEAVEEKASAAKGSKSKKEDNVESYVYRNDTGEICLPSEYVRQSIIRAAKFSQDPRSPRKSAMDLFKAGIIVDPQLSSLGVKEWDYLDKRRVVVQQNGINRVRPAMHKGWKASFEITVGLPEYITRELLLQTLNNAGRLIGVGDNRPSYGRFAAVKFD